MNILITLINLSRTRNNIVFIVSKKTLQFNWYNVDQFCKSEFSIKAVQEDEIWFEKIVHDVEIASIIDSMSYIHKENKLYNNITLARESID